MGHDDLQLGIEEAHLVEVERALRLGGHRGARDARVDDHAAVFVSVNVPPCLPFLGLTRVKVPVMV